MEVKPLEFPAPCAPSTGLSQHSPGHTWNIQVSVQHWHFSTNTLPLYLLTMKGSWGLWIPAGLGQGGSAHAVSILRTSSCTWPQLHCTDTLCSEPTLAHPHCACPQKLAWTYKPVLNWPLQSLPCIHRGSYM